MPSLLQQKKAYNKKYYQESKPHVENRESVSRSRYDKKYYVQNAESVKSKARVKYETDPKKKKASARTQYQCHAESKIAASRARYVVKCNSIKAAARALYKISPGRKRAVARTASRISYVKNCIAKINTVKQYYVSHKRDVCLARKARYILAPPKPDVKELYVKEMQGQLLGDDEARAELMTAFKKLRGSVTKSVCRKVVCRIAAKRLLNKALQIRKEHSASLLKYIRFIKSIQSRILVRTVIPCPMSLTFMTHLTSL